VNGFTLDPNLGEFLLSHSDIRCPARGKYFSANLGHLQQWRPNIRRYVEYLTSNGSSIGRSYSLRYTGAFVADLHRCLISGGVFFYPGDAEDPTGKLRLLYACAPLALLMNMRVDVRATAHSEFWTSRLERSTSVRPLR
jgi:fructose-1,6-bisphosphatase I